MGGNDVRIIGSILLADPAEAFETISGALNYRTPRIPDGTSKAS